MQKTGLWYSLRMIDVTTGWALTNRAILRTKDGGIQWKVVSPSRAHLAVEHSSHNLEGIWGPSAAFLTPSTAWVVAHQLDEGIAMTFRTTDGGQTWHYSMIKSSLLKQITAINAQNGWVISVPPRTRGTPLAVDILRTTDGGETWMKVASSAPASNTTFGVLPPYSTNIAGLSFLDPSTGWATGGTDIVNFAWLYVTHDGGCTWQNQSLPLPSNEAPAQLAISPPTFLTENDGVLPVAFFSGNRWHINFYTTQDAGATWSHTSSVPISTTGANHRNLSLLDRKYWIIPDATLGNPWLPILHVTSNGGYHWTSIQPKTEMTVTNISSINMVSPYVGLALGTRLPPSYPSDVIQEDDATLLLKTVDGGQTWISVPYTVS